MTLLSEKILQTDSGNVTIIAMDHGVNGGTYEGFKDPEETLDKVLQGDPDGVMINPGFARRYKEKLMKEEVIRVVSADFMMTSTIPGISEEMEMQDRLFSVEEMIRNGADAVKALLIFGRENPGLLEKNIKYIAKLGEETRKLGVPFVVEPALWGTRIEDENDPELIENAVRVAFELGADVIKSPYTGEAKTFEPIAENCPLPMLILGGPKAGTDRDVLEQVKSAMNAGARGIIFGRNVWQREYPGKMVKALNMIIHDDCSVEEAVGVL